MNEDQKKQERLDFTNRYFDFWSSFNPGRTIPVGLPSVAKKYYSLLFEEGVKYKDFDQVCTMLEKEWPSLGYEFNLVAYVIEFIRNERAEKIKVEEMFCGTPIKLPVARKEIKPITPDMKRAMETIKMRSPNKLFPLIERINARRAEGGGRYIANECEACLDTGWVEIKKGFVATCTCQRGKRLRTKGDNRIEFYRDNKICKTKQATIKECGEAIARNNGNNTSTPQPAQVETEGAPF